MQKRRIRNRILSDQTGKGAWEKTVRQSLLLAVFVYLLTLFMKLKLLTALIIFLVLFLENVFWQREQQEAERQWNRLEDTALYMEMLLYSFGREGKILSALEAVELSLPDGKLQGIVSDVTEYLRMGSDEDGTAGKALQKIEAAYPGGKIATIHQFMLHVEDYGGNLEEPIRILLEDKRHWESRIRREKKERQNLLLQVLLSALVSMGICAAVLYMPVSNADISGMLVSQVMAAAVVGLNGLVVLKAETYLNTDWTRMDEPENGEKEAAKMWEYQTRNRKKESRKSLILALAGMICCVICMILRRKFLLAAALIITLIFYNQDRIGEYLLKKNLKSALQRAFPRWLLDLVLLMQSENVFVALQKSLDQAPAVLRSELEVLNARLEQNPESGLPYQAFLKEFELPQVRSAMSILYSFTMGTGGAAEGRLIELVRENLEMLDLAEEKRMKDADSGLYLLFLAPVLIGSMKLITDMTLYLLTLLSWR